MRSVPSVALLAAVISVGPLSGTASANQYEGSVDGCLNWSYADGRVSTTVYYNNHCDHAVPLKVRFWERPVDQNGRAVWCSFVAKRKTKSNFKVEERASRVAGGTSSRSC